MCTRFVIASSAKDLASDLQVKGPWMEELSLPSFNVAPFDRIPVLHDQEADRRVTVRPFGVRRQGRVHLNGRIESLSERPMFRPHLMSGRVLIPMSGWYEWTKSGSGLAQPHYLRTRSASALVAGLLLPEGAGHGVILITRPADPSCRAIHERMPHVLDGPHAEAWLRAGSMPEPVLESIEVEHHPVRRAVNRTDATGSDLILRQPTLFDV